MAKKKRVVVVEDESSLLNAICDFLKKRDLEVVPVNDGAKALTVIKREKPDLVILDLLLPHVDGIEVLKDMRKSRWGYEIPVIVNTNNDSIPKMNDCLHYDIKGYFVKSEISLQDLYDSVQQELSYKK